MTRVGSDLVSHGVLCCLPVVRVVGQGDQEERSPGQEDDCGYVENNDEHDASGSDDDDSGSDDDDSGSDDDDRVNKYFEYVQCDKAQLKFMDARQAKGGDQHSSI